MSEKSLQAPVNSPSISVIVPHLNQPDDLEACLSSLDCQTLDSTSFEIIVVDNGSVPIPTAVVTRHPRARLFSERVPGPGPARNTGVLNSAGSILAFIDADCRADAAWLNTALQRINAAPQATILGGDVRIWHDGEQRPTAVEAYECVFGYRFKRYIEQKGFSGTGNLVMRREDFDIVGPFAGIQIAEDIDWGHRAIAAGRSFQYVSDMVVFHPPRRSAGELFAKWDRHILHGFNMTREKSAWRLRWVGRALAVLLSPVVDVFKVLTSDKIHGVTTRLKAATMLFAVRIYRGWVMIKLLWSRQGIVWNRKLGLPDVR